MRDFPPKTNVLAVLLGLLAAACAYGNGPQVQRQATLRQISPQQLAVRLREFYPESQHVPLVQGDRVATSIPTAADHVRLDMSVRDRQVTLAGSPPAVQQLADLIQVWDADPGLSQSRPIRRRPPIRQVQHEERVAQRGNATRRENNQNATSQNANNPRPLDARLRQRLRDLADDVQIETLPDLDAVILRGRNQDIDELAKIIAEIERLAADAQPQIEIINLQHAQSGAISELIDEVADEYTGTRQGRVSVTPLVKPNALLVIGWGNALPATLELVQKLDQPVDPQTQVDVIFLKHAVAATAARTLDEFFSGRDGLGPKVIITPDQRTNAIILHAAPRDVLEARRVLEQLDVARGNSANQVRVFSLEHSLAADTSSVLTSILEAIRGENANDRAAALELLTMDEAGREHLLAVPLDGVTVTPNPRNNTLVISGPGESLSAVAELLRQIDVPQDASQIKVFRVKYGDAAGLVQVLSSLLLAGGATAQRANAAGEGSIAPLRFAVDERTNTIIASGPEGDLRIVEALLARLDESEASQRRNMVYHLKNSPAVDVASAINQFLRTERQLENATPGLSNPFQQIEKEVVVVPEPVNNKLILSATPRYFGEINELIQRLDEPPPQVVIQVLIGEVSLNNAEELGVEIGLQDSVLFDRSLLGDLITTTNTVQTSTADGVITATEQVIQSATNSPGFDFNNNTLGNSGSNRALANSARVGPQGLSHFAVGRINNELGFGGLVLSASSESVSLLIRALQESRRIEILSRPQVRTLDNQPAYVQVGQRVPRIVSSSITQFGQTNAIDFNDVGLILGVTPRISPDGTVVMEIDAEKSSISTEQEGVPISALGDGTVLRAPILNTTRAQTTVSAASGETIVLAGLITKDSVDISRGVPFLSDIPGLGRLFRYDSTIGKRSELLIIMTPHVIYTNEDSERIKQMEVARMSWCAADVFDIHGDINYQLSSDAMLDAPCEVVYPDQSPGGVLDDAHSNDHPVLPLESSIYSTEAEELPPPQSPQYRE